MNHQIIVVLFAFGITLFQAFLVYYQHRKKVVNQLYALYSLSMAVWSFCYFRMITATVLEDAIFWSRALHLGAIFIPMLFLHFVCAWLNLLKNKRIFLWIGYILCFFFLSFYFSPVFIKGAKPIFSFNYFVTTGPLHYLFGIFFFGVVIYTEYLLFSRMKKAGGIYRVQLKYIAYGYLLSYLGGLSAFLPAYNIPPLPLGLYPIPIGMIAITYAILKYRLLDIRVVLGRTLIFMCVYIPILALPFLFVWWAEDYLISILGSNYWVVPTIAECILTLVGLFMYRTIQKSAEQKILKQEYQHEEAIKQLTSELVEVTDKELLIEKITIGIKETVGLLRVSIMLLDEKNELFGVYPENLTLSLSNPIIKYISSTYDIIFVKDLEQYVSGSIKEDFLFNVVAIIPIFDQKQLIAGIILGEKNNSRIFTQIEILALKLFAYQVGIQLSIIKQMDMVKRNIIEREAEKTKHLGNLIAGFAHNLKTPIMSSAGSISIMRDLISKESDTKSSELNSWMDDIQENLVYMDNMIKGVQKQIVNAEDVVEEVTISEIISRVESLMSYELEKGKCSLEVENSFETDFIMKIHLNDLLQVLNVLITNAIDSYQGKGGKILFILEKENDVFVVKIKDNGKGIPQDVQEKLFKKMVTTKGKYGKGLGLYLAYSVVKGRLNGDICFKSSEGRGSEFIIFL